MYSNLTKIILKQNRLIQYLLFIFLISLIGCGGGNDDTTPNQVRNIRLPVLIYQSLTSDDSTPLTDTLNDNPSLINGDLDTAAISQTQNESLNVAIRVNEQSVNLIYLYTTVALSNATLPITFDLLSSSDGNIWEYENSLVFIYDFDEKRFELTIDPLIKQNLLKIVIIHSLSTPLLLSEVEAIVYYAN